MHPKGKKIQDSFIARPGTRYKINLNLHGGGWYDTFDLRDKIRRFNLRLRATGIEELVMNEESIDVLIGLLEQQINRYDTLIKFYQNKKVRTNRLIEEEERKLRLKGSFQSKDDIRQNIKSLKKEHDRHKGIRDETYINRKQKKKLLE